VMGRPSFDFDSAYEPEPNSGCWIWTGMLHRLGYGRLNIRDPRSPRGWRITYAHRYSYERFIGPIPEGLELDHKCRMRCCINPDHLEPVTHMENVRRGRVGEVASARARAITHCPAGHEYAGENLYTRANGNRECRACIRRRAAIRRSKI